VSGGSGMQRVFGRMSARMLGVQKCLDLSMSVPLREALAAVGCCYWELLQERAGAWVCGWAPPLPRAMTCPCKQEKTTDLTPKCVKLVRKTVSPLVSPRGCPQKWPWPPRTC